MKIFKYETPSRCRPLRCSKGLLRRSKAPGCEGWTGYQAPPKASPRRERYAQASAKAGGRKKQRIYKNAFHPPKPGLAKEDKTLSQVGELAFLKRLCRRLPLRGDVIAGAGDDCAIVRAAHSDGFDYLLKSDSCVEGVHFTPQTKGELIGNKALGRVLSDIAAMGGEPLWILVDLVASGKCSVKRIEEIYAGMGMLARNFGAAIVGGDVSAGKELQLHVFGVGRVKNGKAVLRSGAKPGEAIFVTGSLGGSLAGKHLNFQPRLREGQWVAKSGWVTSMIDISDGLLRDLGHITEASNVGARLILNAIPISASVVGHALARGCLMDNPPWLTATPPWEGNSRNLRTRAYAQASPEAPPRRAPLLGGVRNQAPPKRFAQARAGGGSDVGERRLLQVAHMNGLYHALNDGEDYELLFTVPKKKVESFIKAWRRVFRLSCVQIGWTTAQKGNLEGINSEGRKIKLHEVGFDHFR